MSFSTRFLAVATLAATIVVPASAFAQTMTPAPVPGASAMPGRHHHGGRHRGGWRRALATLNVSAAQKQQIDAAFTQAKAANANVTDPATRKANAQKLHAQIEAILTPAQRTQLQAQMRKHRENAPMPGSTPHA